MWMVAAYRWTHRPIQLASFVGWQPLGADANNGYGHDDSTINIDVLLLSKSSHCDTSTSKTG